MHRKTSKFRVKARWNEACRNLSPGYQTLGDTILSRSALGMGQLDEFLSLMEESGLLLRSLPDTGESP